GTPVMNGYEACERLRCLPWAEGLTIIAQTGWGQEEDRRRTRAAGFDHHFVKPLDVLALDAMLRQLAGVTGA
ncbi:MAG: hybrid sensor histidine kinase/response regulator, partial [Caldimonas sp.]